MRAIQQAKDAIHRHNANVFVYVLEGSVGMQVRGGKLLGS
jgi:hypothetical protein